jgi:hypothetical protein
MPAGNFKCIALVGLGLLVAGSWRGLNAAEPQGSAKPTSPALNTPEGPVSIFPAEHPWNTAVTGNAVHRLSAVYLQRVGLDKPLHPDFGVTWKGAPNGIPYVVAPAETPLVPVRFTYADESDPGPYPVPANAPIEGGPRGDGDRHVIVIDPKRQKLYELFNAFPEGRGWKADSGAIFNLQTGELRPKGWTSADAAGLPIFPGLVRYDEVVVNQSILHALRFTVKQTQRGYISPATHFASNSKDDALMPMGLRVRLKQSVPIDQFPPAARVILTALKTYGMLVADNGGDFFLSGAPDPRWDTEQLATLKRIKVRDFEVVDTGEIER